MVIPVKYQPAALPATAKEAIDLAEEREQWACMARNQDKPGSAREWELTALLLRFYAEHFKTGGH